MNTRILAGALALVMWGGGVAFAQDRSDDCVRVNDELSMGTEANVDSDVDALDDSEAGIGGSGLDSDVSGSANLSADQEGVGGAGKENCPEPYGGSGMDESSSALESDVPAEEPQTAQPEIVPVPVPAPMTAVVVEEEEEAKEDEPNLAGLTLLLGGGVEGYTGALAPQVDPGATWGVAAGLRPTKLIGLELAYSGAANEVDGIALGEDNLTAGADIIRNGGEAVATIGLAQTAIQPYLLGGVGFSHYNVREGEGARGFRDDTNGSIPVGAGIRGVVGNFTADARLGYSFLFDQEFADAGDTTELGGEDFTDGGRYSGMLRLGTQF